MAITEKRNCVQCGSSYETKNKRRIYCSSRCNYRAADQRKKKLRRRSVSRGKPRCWSTCPECQQAFRKTRGDSHRNGPQVHCSRACRNAEANRRNALKRLIVRERHLYRQWSWRAHRVGRINRCRDCDMEVEKNVQRCDGCRDKAAKRRLQRRKLSPSYRAERARRDALRQQRLSAEGCEKFDPFEIFERDGWSCYLCGRATPKSARGLHFPWSPELDHVFPLSKGGKHTRKNTRCACRKCNHEKSDAILPPMAKDFVSAP